MISWLRYGSFATIALIALGSRHASAVVKLPSLFSRHMVLQRDADVPVWGWANAGELVTVSLADQTRQTVAGADGRWQLRLDKLAAGGPHTLTVKGTRNQIKVVDVYIGEVWLASGQSNMVHLMPYYRNFAQEFARADCPQLRLFTVGRTISQLPKDDCIAVWHPCGPTTIDDYSALAYFFGRKLHERLGVPVGIIVSALGSTPIEAWTSRDAQESKPELKPLLTEWDKKGAEYDPIAAQTAYQQLEASSIHPSNKKPFAERLALWARAEVYRENIPWSGPRYAGHQRRGAVIELSFQFADGGLQAREGGLRGFVIIGADQHWRPGAARVVGDKVHVSSAEVTEPIAVRYSWSPNPDGNLINWAGLPASPFRTDHD